MSQTLSNTSSFTLPGPSKRLAQFGVAMIATLLVACFGVLIAARGDHAPAAEMPAMHGAE